MELHRSATCKCPLDSEEEMKKNKALLDAHSFSTDIDTPKNCIRIQMINAMWGSFGKGLCKEILICIEYWTKEHLSQE